MSRKYRISSPQVFEAVVTNSETFGKHDWLFDNHPGIISGFRPDVRVFFDSNKALARNQFGRVATIDRRLVAHPSVFLGKVGWSLAELEAQTYVTMSHDDDSFLSVKTADGFEAQLRPTRVFRGNDVLAAKIAVKLNIGYSALPEFLLKDQNSKPKINATTLAGWEVSPTYLRIESTGIPGVNLSMIHEELVSILTPLVNSSWRSFGQKQNVVRMASSQ